MTDVRWENRFKPATYGPVVAPAAGPWRTLLDPGQLAAQDLAANEVAHYLRFDPVLAAVFKGRFDRVPWLPTVDMRDFPRCAIYLASNFNDERPTSTVINRVSVFVATCWAIESIRPLDDGAASVATVLAHIKRVALAPRNRTLFVYRADATTVSLANEPVHIAGESYGPLVDLSGRVNGVAHEVELQYLIHTDRDDMGVLALTQ